MLSRDQILALNAKYNLPAEQLHPLVASAIEKTATRILRKNVKLQEDGSFEVNSGRIDADELSQQVKRGINRQIKLALGFAVSQRTKKQAFLMVNTLVWGKPIYRDGKIEIHTETGLIGYVSPNALPEKERGIHRLAGAKAWFCNHISGKDHKTPVFNRTSIRLPELLIKHFAAGRGLIVEVECLERYPGDYSAVSVSRPLPEWLIEAVCKELSGEVVKISMERSIE